MHTSMPSGLGIFLGAVRVASPVDMLPRGADHRQNLPGASCPFQSSGLLGESEGGGRAWRGGRSEISDKGKAWPG